MKRPVLILFGLLFAGCNLIYDDLSVCGKDYYLNYEMRLVTDIQMTIDEKLTTIKERPIADTLRQWMAPIFSGEAHDLDMSFFSTDELDRLRYHKNEIINAKQKSYTLYIPREDYMHLALVNILNNQNIAVSGEDHAATMRIAQISGDTLDSHPTAIYSARLPMQMAQEGDESYYVHLYMVSSAVALVVDSAKIDPLDMKVVLSGTATGFDVRDSAFTYDNPSLIRAERLTDLCYAMVSLPSRSAAAAPAPALLPEAKKEAGYWQLKVYVRKPDNTVTETVLSVDYPLLAGRLEIIKVELHEDGSVVPLANSHVGASVTLDWKAGGEHEIDI